MAPEVSENVARIRQANRVLKGRYALRLQGFLRSKSSDGSVIKSNARPLLGQPAWLLAAQMDTSREFPAPDVTVPNGFYPYALIGHLVFDGDGVVTGGIQISIGGNANGNLDPIKEGTYQVNPDTLLDGTITITDARNEEQVTYCFEATEGFIELELLPINPDVKGDTRTSTATGVLKRQGA